MPSGAAHSLSSLSHPVCRCDIHLMSGSQPVNVEDLKFGFGALWPVRAWDYTVPVMILLGAATSSGQISGTS